MVLARANEERCCPLPATRCKLRANCDGTELYGARGKSTCLSVPWINRDVSRRG